LFSTRTSQNSIPNALSAAWSRARHNAARSGALVFDLTVSNPTASGIPYDEREILEALADPRALTYAPEPLGLAHARQAVAKDFAAWGIAIHPSRIALTASTSEGYSALFKILADAGDEILVPAPSYPLLGFLAAFESLRLRSYPLVYAGSWHVDLDELRRSITHRTRATVVVAPNNPTGSYLGRGELDAMLDLGLPVVSDEVFARYPLGRTIPEGRVPSVLGARRGLTFALSGLSKLAALPQMKLGWIGVAGDDARADQAMARLEFVLDAYLTVGAPVQYALDRILASHHVASDAISRRIRTNLALARTRVAETQSSTVLNVEGGWYAMIRVPETQSDEQWALDLAERDGVYVHPGYFFDMQRGAHLVVSLLTPETIFEQGMARICARLNIPLSI
jgi:aspartate/methionine/tyrosine aminotransferase